MRKIVGTVVVLVFILWGCLILVNADQADDLKTGVETNVLLPVFHFFNVRQGWQINHIFALDLGLEQFWWDQGDDGYEASFSLKPLQHTGLGLGLSYKKAPNLTGASDKYLAMFIGQLNLSVCDFQFFLSDKVSFRFLGDFAPLEKIESNHFETLVGRTFGQLTAELKYGFCNWRPFSQRQESIIAFRRLRLAWAETIDQNDLLFGYQTISQRLASDFESWRWRSWLGCFVVVEKFPFRLDIAYNWGKMEQAHWWLIQESDQHQLELKVILGGGRENGRRS